MEALLKITDHNGKSVVSARELYDFLEIKTDFTEWCKRMFEYGFQEDMDFTPILGKSSGGRPSKDYALTIDCAKEISMLQRSEKGKQARLYFIDCEKQLLQPRLTKEQMTLMVISDLQLTVADQLIQLEQKDKIIQEQAPKVKFVDNVLAADDCFPITLIAKELGMSALTLNHKLSNLKIQYKQNETWVLYSQYQDKGYTKSRTHLYYDSTGVQRTAIHTYWTERGRAFIHGKINPVFNIQKAG